MVEDIVESTLVLLGKTGSEKTSPRGKTTYRELIQALISTDSLPQAAAQLIISEDTLYKTLSRYTSKEIEGKPSNVSWKQFLLGLSNYKECQKCKQILLLKQYNKDSSTWDGYNYSCRSCRALVKQKFTEQNPEYAKIHYLENKSDYLANAARYRAQLGLAQPAWANEDKIKEIYKHCPTGYHVDHIFPLQSDWVCGLHVENNLQCIPANDNLKKSNKFIPELHN